MKGEKRERRMFLPTSHDIQQACNKMQEQWSEWERRKRSGWVEEIHWLPPEVDSLLYDIFPDSY